MMFPSGHKESARQSQVCDAHRLSACLRVAAVLAALSLLVINPYVFAQSMATDGGTTAGGAEQTMADLVVILKADRVLYLYANGRIIGQYPIALGKNPVGTKRRRGDDKTPIGAYTLDWRNPKSIFHRSLHISYPNADDVAVSRSQGVDPGDMIMIHGQPDYDNRERKGDWTNGCIAVSNAAIDDIWARVADGTRVHIYP